MIGVICQQSRYNKPRHNGGISITPQSSQSNSFLLYLDQPIFMAKGKVAIIFYSMYSSITLTDLLYLGTVTSRKWPMRRQKVFVKLVWKSTCFSTTYNYLNLMNRVPETLSEEVLQKMYAQPKPDIPVASTSTLTEYDYFLFGIRFNFLFL
jgi:hypothetical protein